MNNFANTKKSFMLNAVIHLYRQMKIFEMNNSIDKIFKTTSIYPRLNNARLLNRPTDISVDQQQNRTSELIAIKSETIDGAIDQLIDCDADVCDEITNMDRRVYLDINRCLKAPNSGAYDEKDYELGFMMVIELRITLWLLRLCLTPEKKPR